MPQFVVKTAFKVRGNDLEKAFKKAGVQAEIFGKKSRKAFGQASKSALSFKSIMGGVLGASAVMHGTMLLRQGIRGAIGGFVEFDQALTSAGAKFPVMAKRGSEAFAALKATAQEVGATTEFTTVQAGKGLEFLAMAGFNTQQAMAALPLTVDLATASNMDLARATDIASDALGAFGLQTKDSAQLTTNLSRINDVFAKTVTSANTDMEMLFEAMTDGGPTMTTAGQSIETFSALVGTMANAGIKGSKAGTTLKNAVLRLASPVGKAKAILEKLNIATDDGTGNMRDMFAIIGDLKKATADMGTKQRAAALDTIFSKRAVAGMSVVLDQSTEKMDVYRDSLLKAKGASKDMAAEMRKSLQNRLKTLQSTVNEMAIKFLSAFEKKFPKAIDDTINALRDIDMSAVIQDVKDFFAIVKKVWTVLGALKPILSAAAGGFIAYRSALAIATAAQWVMNVAMTANPIGVVIVAIGALIGLVAYLATNWDSVTEVMQGAWLDTTQLIERTIRSVRSTIGGWFRSIFSFLDKMLSKLEWARDLMAKFKKGLLDSGDLTGGTSSRFGKGLGGTKERTAPNQSAAESQAATAAFTGSISIFTPDGVDANAEFSGAPNINMSVMGANL